MILPIVAYGNPVLKKKANEISKEYPKLHELINNMFETMYNAHGVGLAAPQIGLPIRLFVVDATPFGQDEDLSKEEQEQLKNFKKVFINPTITEESGIEWVFNEGCLSIPDVREDVFRKPNIKISYLNENFEPQEEVLDGLAARVVQHEYDHIEGILFTDKLSSFKKRLIKGKLASIEKGRIDVEYRMVFSKVSRKR